MSCQVFVNSSYSNIIGTAFQNMNKTAAIVLIGNGSTSISDCYFRNLN
jgi:hypothetical protein